jgi:anion-transporting  ArsA/GET3 family ATPase
MERLFELHEEGQYDLIVVDTPPSAHASDLLDAPARMADFFDSRLLKFLVAPNRSRLASITAKPFMQLADRLLGKRFLADISAFFTMLESMRPGFIDRAEKVQALIASDETTFVVVTTLEPAAVHEAGSLIDQLEQRNFEIDAIVANRVLPVSLPPEVESGLSEQTADWRARAEDADLSAKAVERVLGELRANAVRLRHLSELQQEQSKTLAGRARLLSTVPWMSGELRNLGGLSKLGQKIW